MNKELQMQEKREPVDRLLFHKGAAFLVEEKRRSRFADRDKTKGTN